MKNQIAKQFSVRVGSNKMCQISFEMQKCLVLLDFNRSCDGALCPECWTSAAVIYVKPDYDLNIMTTLDKLCS